MLEKLLLQEEQQISESEGINILTHVQKGSDGEYIQITEMVKNNDIESFFFKILQLHKNITKIL